MVSWEMTWGVSFFYIHMAVWEQSALTVAPEPLVYNARRAR